LTSYEQFKLNQEKLINSLATDPPPSNAPTQGSVIWGEVGAFSGKTRTVGAGTIDDMSGTVNILGEVFFLRTRDIWGGKLLIKFDVETEDSMCVSCKLILEKTVSTSVRSNVINSLKVGTNILLRGDAQYDKYSREIVLNTLAIKLLPPTPVRPDNAPEKRVELHLHTQMSAMDGVSPASDLIARAIHWGHSAMAITDHGVVQAFPDGHKAARKHKNFKLIYGVEAYLSAASSTENPTSTIPPKYYHAVILVQNYEGLRNLYQLITDSHINNFYKKPRISKQLLAANRQGLLLGSACEQGELFRAILDGKPQTEIDEIADFYDYFEVMPLGNNKFMVENGITDFDGLKEINRKIIELGRRKGKLVTATGDVHFLDEKHAKNRAILQAGQGFADADNQAPLFFHTTAEMLAEFDYLDDATAREIVITNPNKIADKIERIQPIPDETFPPVIEGSEQEIQQLCYTRAAEIYGENLPETVANRMEKELNKINKYGFSVMYIIAQKLVAKSLSDGYVVGSRGSVGSSFVAFLCGITDVNALPPHYICPRCHHSEFITDGSQICGIDMPDKPCPHCSLEKMTKDGYDIPFETFLGFEGDKEPDIDLNFSGDYQTTAHKYVEELFGVNNVYRAGTISTLADKTTYGFVKKYMESRGENNVNNATINRLVQGCIGVKRTTGQHPGGVMVLPKGHDIHEFCPVQHPADDKSKNVLTTHFDYHSISGRLLKLDILGHDDPTVIKVLEDFTGISAKSVPLDDPATLSLFTSTKVLGVTPEQIGSKVGTFGVPEFGTKFVRQMLLDTKPTTLAELIRISGLSHGTDVWLNNAQNLVKEGVASLKEIICTRDDIMTYLMYQGLTPKSAFDIMERVRKGKKLLPSDEKIMREHRVPEWYISSCNRIQYMFPKAHAVAYVTMAFRIAWYKVHQPLAFYLAYFSVRADEFNAQTMTDQQIALKTLRKLETIENTLNAKDKNVITILQVVRETFARGFEFLPVDLYSSEVSKFTQENGKIRPPLISVPGLGENAAIAIKEARDKSPFSSVDDLKTRGKVNKTVMELLEQQGCLEGMPESDQLSFF
jgi:DNA polymerase-3 subunit alpha (Gram-positive type)